VFEACAVDPCAADAALCTDADFPSDRSYDVSSYALTASFDKSESRLKASVEIALTRQDLSAKGFALDSRVNSVTSVSAAGAELRTRYDADAGVLLVHWPESPWDMSGAEVRIDYEAVRSRGLQVHSEGHDALSSPVVYTMGEPELTAYWMPGNHRPSDRATFSVELTLDADEDAIANGIRALDERSDGQRRVRYVFSRPIPTYVMAFAIGQFEHQTLERSGKVPLTLWYRRGLGVAASANLERLAARMDRMESLVGRYPFETYGVVLLPEFPGGMENASITFVDEAAVTLEYADVWADSLGATPAQVAGV
jgi:aminopeptidase N